MAIPKNAQMNSLGKAQADLEAATSELKNAQAAYEKAESRLTLATEVHQTTLTALVLEAGAVRANAKVVPSILK